MTTLTPKHGDERNKRMRSWTGRPGTLLEGMTSREETWAEHYCEVCGEWVDGGFYGFLACPECKTPWSELLEKNAK